MNQPMRSRAIRVPDPLWTAAMKQADERDETLSQVVRRFLERYSRPLSDLEPAIARPVTLPEGISLTEAGVAMLAEQAAWDDLAELAEDVACDDLIVLAERVVTASCAASNILRAQHAAAKAKQSAI
jgi:hypothetical protein